MDYSRNNTSHTIYYPNDVQKPTNQRTSYFNNIEVRLCEIEEYYKAMNDRFQTENECFNRRLTQLQTDHQMMAELQKKIISELSKHTYRQDNVKKEFTKRLEDIESITTEKLNSLLIELRKRNQLFQSKIVNLQEDVMKEIHPLRKQQEAFREEIDKQEIDKSQLYNQLEQMKGLLDLQGRIIKQDLQPQQEQLKITTDHIQNKILEQESVIREEFQPFLKDIQEALSNPIANLLKKLTPGTLLKQLTVNGTVFEGTYFLDFDVQSNLATFLIDGKIGSINTTRIDSLTFG